MPEQQAVRLVLTAHHQALTLEDAAWERLLPNRNLPEDTSFRPESPGQTAREWFGNDELRAGETRVSKPIPLSSGTGAVVFKVCGRDRLRRTVTAWAIHERSHTPAQVRE